MMGVKSGYIIHEVIKNKKYALCKIINEYTNEEAALDDLLKVLKDATHEVELQKKYLESLKSVL